MKIKRKSVTKPLWEIPKKGTIHHDSILNSNSYINIWVGSYRAMKTSTSCFRFMLYILEGECPEGEILITGNTLASIRRNILTPMEYVFGKRVCRFGLYDGIIHNRHVNFVGGKDESSHKPIQGSTFAGALCDEITTNTQTFFDTVVTRLSITGAKLFGTTNPDHPEHWLKTNYIDKESLDIRTFNFSLRDNPYLSENYIRTLELSTPGVWKTRYIDGKWAAGVGTIYPFIKENHVTKTADIVQRMSKVWAACDHGTTNPLSFGVYGLDYDGSKIFKLAEYYYDSTGKNMGETASAGKKKTDAEYVRDITMFLRTKKLMPSVIYIDPSAASFIEEMRRNSFPVVSADNSVSKGIQYVATQLHTNRYLVDESCENTIREFYSYSWDGKKVDTPIKKNDHCMDCDRYALYSHRNHLGDDQNIDWGIEIAD
jgi:PBSX family phage terminase large subunit